MQRLRLRGLATAVAVVALAANVHLADAALKHRYSFTANANDSVGAANGTVVDPGGIATFAGGRLNLSANNGESSNQAPFTTGAYVDLPNGIVSALGNTGSFELWVDVATNRDWAEMLSFGRSNDGEDIATGGNGSKYLALIPDTGDGNNQLGFHLIEIGGLASNIGTATNQTLTTGTLHHIVGIVDATDTMGGVNPNGTTKLYLDGALQATGPLQAGLALGTLNDLNNWLGRSQWPDALFDGSFDEVRMYDSALSADQVALNAALGPDQMATVPAAGIISLEVNTVTNAIKIKNNVSVPLKLSYYEILSAGGALSTPGWNSLDDQEADAPGLGWDEAGVVNANQLIELVLPTGGASVAANQVSSLGGAFNKSIFGNGVNGDLTFKFGLSNGSLLSGSVSYVTTAGQPGDYDNDLDVDGNDFLIIQRGFGTTYTSTDLAAWKANFGAHPSVGASTAAPEPATAAPEPATGALVSAVALAMLLWRPRTVAAPC